MPENDIRNNNDDVRNNNNEATNNQNNAAANENFQIRPNMAWTDEQIEKIATQAREHVERFAQEVPTKLTPMRRARIRTIVKETIKPYARENHTLTPALKAEINGILSEEVDLYAEQRQTPLPPETIELLRNLIGRSVDFCAARYNTLTQDALECIQSLTRDVFRDMRRENEDNDEVGVENLPINTIELNEVDEITKNACRRIQTYAEEYETWNYERIEHIGNSITQNIERYRGANQTWTNELYRQVKEAACGDVATYDANLITPDLLTQMQEAAKKSLKLYVNEHWIELDFELKDKYALYLKRFAGVPEQNVQALPPLWDDLQSFKSEDTEVIIGKWNAALKHHYDTARNANETPSATRNFLEQNGYPIDGRELSLTQVLDCIYCGRGFTGIRGALKGNVLYDLAFTQLKIKGNNACKAFDFICHNYLTREIENWASKNHGDVEFLNEIEFEDWYDDLRSIITVDGKARGYRGDAGLNRFLIRVCERDWKNRWDQRQLRLNDLVNNDGNGDDSDPGQQTADEKQAFVVDGRLPKLLAKVEDNIDIALRNVTEDLRRRVYRLHIIERWTSERVANETQLTQTQAYNRYRAVNQEVVKALRRAFEEVCRLNVRDVMAEDSKKRLRVIYSVLVELENAENEWNPKLITALRSALKKLKEERREAQDSKSELERRLQNEQDEKRRLGGEKTRLDANLREVSKNLARIRANLANANEEQIRTLRQELEKSEAQKKAWELELQDVKCREIASDAFIRWYKRDIETEKKAIAYIDFACNCKAEKKFVNLQYAAVTVNKNNKTLLSKCVGIFQRLRNCRTVREQKKQRDRLTVAKDEAREKNATEIRRGIAEVRNYILEDVISSTIISLYYQNNLNAFWQNADRSSAEQVSRVIDVWLERVRNINPETGEYNAIVRDNAQADD